MTSVWYISKYCRLPDDNAGYIDAIQVEGCYPSRGFSLLREISKLGISCTLFNARHNFRPFRKSNSQSTTTRRIAGVCVCTVNVWEFTKTHSLNRVLSWIHFEIALLLVEKRKFDRPSVIIVSSLSLLSVISGLILSRKYKVPLVFEVRDIWPLVLTENGGYSKLNPFVFLLRRIEKLGYREATALVATMPNLAPHVEATLGYARKVECVPMGISDELKTGSNIEVSVPIKAVFDSHLKVITYAGSIGVDNALENFLEEASRIIREKDVAVLIVGGGDLLEYYREKYREAEKIIFVGRVPQGMIQGILQQSTILFFATHATSVFQFGQSLNKVVDYMYSGRPIIGVMTGYHSMLNESGCGVFVEAEDSMGLRRELEKMLKLSDEDLNEMGAAGAAWLKRRRDYSILAVEYQRIIDRCIQPRAETDDYQQR